MRRRDRGKDQASKRALDAAQEGLRKTKERSDEVTRVVTSIRLIREHNHFADQLRYIFGGGPHDARH